MTKERQNQIVKDAMARSLRKRGSIPEDIGDTYRNWLNGVIRGATAQLVEPEAKPQMQGRERA